MIHLNEDDFKLAAEHTQIDVRYDYLKPYLEVKMEDMAKPKTEGYLPLNDGDIFDLGDLHVEVFDFKGHTEGSVGILIKEDETAILGDALNSMTFLQFMDKLTLNDYVNNVKEVIRKYGSEIKHVLFSHGHNTGTPVILKEAIETVEEVLNGEQGLYLENIGPLMSGCYMAKEVDNKMNRIDGKTFNMVYKK